MEGGSDDFEEVKVPLWITGSKLEQIYTTFVRLNQLQQSNVLCDVNINVENTKFPAHKAVLAASSRFFHTMFTSRFQESRESDVCVSGRPETFKIILHYIYSCELPLSVDTVVDVLEMAHYLQLDLVMKRCEQYLIDDLSKGLQLDVKAALISMATASKFELEELIEAAKRFIAKNFVPTDNFLDLMTGELLEEILGRNDLKDEKQVFDTTIAWLHQDWDNRKNFAPALFRKIRLGIVPVGHLSKSVFKYPELYAITECRELIDTALDTIDTHKAGDAPRHFIEPNLFTTRTMISVKAGFKETLGIDANCGYYYDNDTKRWITPTKISPLPEKDNDVNGDSFLSTNGQLYVCRGTGSLSKRHPQFLRLDMPKNRWIPLTSMLRRRKNTFLVAGSDRIYAIGGDTDLGSFSCELYIIECNSWSILPSLNFDNGSAFCKPCTIETCKVYKDKLLVYGRKTVYGEGEQTSNSYYLVMYDTANSERCTFLQEFKCMVGLSHVIRGLVINDDRCYRIISCLCSNHAKSECPHRNKAQVEEMVINFERKTAHLGNVQLQPRITVANVPDCETTKAFRVNQDVYVIYKKRFFKTGIKVPHTGPVELGSWDQIKHISS